MGHRCSRVGRIRWIGPNPSVSVAAYSGSLTPRFTEPANDRKIETQPVQGISCPKQHVDSMADVKLFLLGAPYLAVDGQVVEIQRRKVLALLSYLAVTGQPHRRDTLATLLWPDSGQSQARAALGRHLSELRDLVGADHVQADRETIGLIGNLWLDVHHSQQLIAGRDPTAPAARERFSQAVSLYRGDFMTGFTLPDCPDFDEWQFFQSENLRQQFANALAHLITMHCADGDYGAALPHARRRLVLDTLDEAAHRQVMELYARSGQVSAALRQYEPGVSATSGQDGCGHARL